MTNLIKSCSVSKNIGLSKHSWNNEKTAQGAEELKMNRILTVAKINATEQENTSYSTAVGLL